MPEKTITITRSELVDAMHVYNNNVLRKPDDYAEFTGERRDAEQQADEIIRIIMSTN